MVEKKKTTGRRGTRKPRTHGYSGYGSGKKPGSTFGGAVHWGRGFGGVDVLDAGGSPTLLDPGLFTEDQKEKKRKS
ncbi:MAG TPA: hypothetical protein VEG84_08315 [Thermoanaerobaculia bacterium]|nr:hypothetical protein [Thermoanaerobaculia bacterium]